MVYVSYELADVCVGIEDSILDLVQSRTLQLQNLSSWL